MADNAVAFFRWMTFWDALGFRWRPCVQCGSRTLYSAGVSLGRAGMGGAYSAAACHAHGELVAKRAASWVGVEQGEREAA